MLRDVTIDTEDCISLIYSFLQSFLFFFYFALIDAKNKSLSRRSEAWWISSDHMAPPTVVDSFNNVLSSQCAASYTE